MVLRNNFLGHSEIYSQLSEVFLSDKLSSSYLFIGPPGIGKKHIAWSLIQERLCENKKQTQVACGTCSNCKKIALHSHEAVLYVEPDGALIKTHQAQEIHHFLNLQTLHKHRFILINDAHLMNMQAGNSLLKILEEPPAYTTFILIAPTQKSVMQTLLSRSITVRFHPLKSEDMKHVKDLKPWMILASQGRMDLLNALKNSEQDQIREKSVQFLKLLFQNNFKDYSAFVKNELKEKEIAIPVLHFSQQMIRDLYFSKIGEFLSVIHQDKIQDLQHDFKEVSYFDYFERLCSLERDIALNVDRQLGFESLFIQKNTF